MTFRCGGCLARALPTVDGVTRFVGQVLDVLEVKLPAFVPR
jgi:hypothetical protein